MLSRPFNAFPVAPGRPRKWTLTAEERLDLAAIYLETNRTAKSGSMELAWVLFAEARPASWAWTVRDHRVDGALPVEVVEVMRKARPLVGAHRGGSKRLRSEGPYVPGTMRRHHEEARRLRAGERFSVDDITRDIACWIPWPWGGCPCSDRYGVRLGRWQTLVVLDDATNMAVAASTVFRFEQSYRGSDVASLIIRTERDIGMPDQWVLEGGVWQGERVLSLLGDRWISAKGRPNQKLVERWIHEMHTRLSVELGNVGRRRGEIRKNSETYVACRAGRRDPRDHFLAFETSQAAFDRAVCWLNDREVRSRDYGTWTPSRRWDLDTAANPRTCRAGDELWLAAPVARDITVRRLGVLRLREVGPHGIPMDWVFTADWLHEHEGRQVRVFFDPLEDWPVTAAVALPGSRKLLGTAVCLNPFGEARDAATEMVGAVRRSMMREYRAIAGSKIVETEIRTPARTLETISGEQAAGVREAGARAVVIPIGRDGADHEPRRNDGGGPLPGSFSQSLRRRAEAAKLKAGNF